MKLFRLYLFLMIWQSLGCALLNAADKAIITVEPTVTKSIRGISELERKKYFNLSNPGSKFESTVKDQGRINYYLNELGMTFGRDLGGVHSEVRYGNSIYEDAGRPGYVDLDRFIAINQADQKITYSSNFFRLFSPNLDVALHDRNPVYPEFMGKYYTSSAGPEEWYPENLDAAAELAVAFLQYNYSDFTRPAYYEIVNEPHWSYPGDQHFADLHTKITERAHSSNLPVKIGGPCSSVAYYYRNNYQDLDHFTQFIDNTNCNLDFYSFHVYDYFHWDRSTTDFVGRVTTGLPIAGVLDALNNYCVNTYGKEINMVISEHGGYVSDDESKKMIESLARAYFPGSGFEWEMQIKSIHDFIKVSSSIANTMVFMDNPHMILKAVPFIILESYSWDPKYGASLLVANNYTDKSNWYETRLIDFYRFFAGVQGRRVKGFCSDPDVQFHAFVNNDELLLVMNNLSNEPQPLQFDVSDLDNVSEITARRLGRQQDFRPYFVEETVGSLDTLTLRGREAMLLTLRYKSRIRPQKAVDEIPYYGDKVAQYIANSATFNVEIPQPDSIDYAVLRISLDRPAGSDHDIAVELNGVTLDVPLEDAAERFEDSKSYASMKMVQLDPALLQEQNSVTISWPDGKRGGVGSVIIRAARYAEVVDDVPGVEGESFGAYPNPFQKELVIDLYETSRSGRTTVAIYDIRGRLMRKTELTDGHNQFIWDGRNAQDRLCSSGVYFVRVKGDTFSSVQRVTFLK